MGIRESAPDRVPEGSVPGMRWTTRCSPGARELRRLLVRFVLLTGVVLAGTAGLSGSASAAAPTVTPLLDCAFANGDGSLTVVLGYTSSYPNQVSIPLTNKKNYTNPASYGSALPTRFQAGTHHGVAALTIPKADRSASPSWYLDGTTLFFPSSPAASGKCDAVQLPGFANGAALTVGFVLTGVVGALVVWRVRRRAAVARAGEARIHA
jgi:hypothetical protein